MATTKAKAKSAPKKRAAKVEVTPEEVLNYMRMRGQYAQVVDEVRERKLVTDAARAAGIKVSGTELQKAADGYRALMDLNKASDTQRWFNDNHLTIEGFEDYLETNILKSKFMDKLEKSSTKVRNAKPVRQAIRQLAYREWLNGRK
jgi:hypothetical protein